MLDPYFNEEAVNAFRFQEEGVLIGRPAHRQMALLRNFANIPFWRQELRRDVIRPEVMVQNVIDEDFL